MQRFTALAIALVALVITVAGATGQSRVIEMGITSPELASYFQAHAGANDIARVDHPNDIGLINGLTVGRKMAIFKSVGQINQFLASNAGAIDIIGYNLEPGQQHEPAELADPVAAAKAVKALADQYGKAVAVGLTHDLTLQYGAAMAPYADIWVLQIQRAQNDPAMAGEFVNQMVPALKAANPQIAVFVQIRTDSQPAALASLVNGLGPVNVSILTQRQDVQDAVAVAGAFFGTGGQQQPASWMNDYGYRIPSKDGQWLLPVATRLLGSTDDDHVHRGSINSWDLSASVGTPVFASAAGTVEAAGCYLYEQHRWPIMQGYGCAISIKHGAGIVSQYGHCLENSIRVKVGDQVTAQTPLCQVGRTGVTSFSHTHFTILKNGSPVRMDGIFDRNLMRYCHLCSGKNDPAAPIAGTMPAGNGQQPVMTTSKGQQLLQLLASLPAEQFALLVAILIFGLLFIGWIGGLYVRVALVGACSAAVVAGCMAYLFTPTAINAGQQPAASGQGWEWAYPIIQSMEGWGCTNDGAYTMGGVTQGTYNRWRAKHGQPAADVCANLTREQAKQIYYELFWLPIGADQLPPQLALTAVDHYINTGAVRHLLNQCGTDVGCFNQARIADYKTKSNFYLYGVAWINRVNKIRKFTGG